MLKVQNKPLFKIPETFAPSKEFLDSLREAPVIGKQKIYFDKGSGTYVMSSRMLSKYFEVVEPSGTPWLMSGADLSKLLDKLEKKLDIEYLPKLKTVALMMNSKNIIEVLLEKNFCLAHYLNDDLTVQDLNTLFRVETSNGTIQNKRSVTTACENVKYLPIPLQQRLYALERPELGNSPFVKKVIESVKQNALSNLRPDLIKAPITIYDRSYWDVNQMIRLIEKVSDPERTVLPENQSAFENWRKLNDADLVKGFSNLTFHLSSITSLNDFLRASRTESTKKLFGVANVVLSESLVIKLQKLQKVIKESGLVLQKYGLKWDNVWHKILPIEDPVRPDYASDENIERIFHRIESERFSAERDKKVSKEMSITVTVDDLSLRYLVRSSKDNSVFDDDFNLGSYNLDFSKKSDQEAFSRILRDNKDAFVTWLTKLNEHAHGSHSSELMDLDTLHENNFPITDLTVTQSALLGGILQNQLIAGSSYKAAPPYSKYFHGQLQTTRGQQIPLKPLHNYNEESYDLGIIDATFETNPSHAWQASSDIPTVLTLDNLVRQGEASDGSYANKDDYEYRNDIVYLSETMPKEYKDKNGVYTGFEITNLPKNVRTAYHNTLHDIEASHFDSSPSR